MKSSEFHEDGGYGGIRHGRLVATADFEDVSGVALEEKKRLEAAGTLVDLERLTMEIGDELARQLAGLMLSSRAEDALEQNKHCCPDCGKACDVESPVATCKGCAAKSNIPNPAVIAPAVGGLFFPVAKVPQRPPRQSVTPLVLEKNEAFDWRESAPELLSREVIASGEDAEDFGRHLEWKAWTQGVFTARRQAFVADGLAVNWTIHKRHFSQRLSHNPCEPLRRPEGTAPIATLNSRSRR